MTLVEIGLVVLALVIVAANTLLAVAFLRSQRGPSRTSRGRDDDALDELHRRVQELPAKRE
jgi:hypothetical protein